MRRPLCAEHGQLRRLPRGVRLYLSRAEEANWIRAAPDAGEFQSAIHGGGRLGYVFPKTARGTVPSGISRGVGQITPEVDKARATANSPRFISPSAAEHPSRHRY